MDAVFNTKGIPPAEVVKFQGKYYIMDGHHRIASDLLKNKKHIPAHVYNYDVYGSNINKALQDSNLK